MPMFQLFYSKALFYEVTRDQLLHLFLQKTPKKMKKENIVAKFLALDNKSSYLFILRH